MPLPASSSTCSCPTCHAPSPFPPPQTHTFKDTYILIRGLDSQRKALQHMEELRHYMCTARTRFANVFATLYTLATKSLFNLPFHTHSLCKVTRSGYATRTQIIHAYSKVFVRLTEQDAEIAVAPSGPTLHVSGTGANKAPRLRSACNSTPSHYRKPADKLKKPHTKRIQWLRKLRPHCDLST